MAKAKTVTVNQLHKMLSKLIEKGEGRVPVCVNKNTFYHPLESDGCVILAVRSCAVQVVPQMDGDGSTEFTSSGKERCRRNVVLAGGY